MTNERAEIDRDSISITKDTVTVSAPPPSPSKGHGERPSMSAVSDPPERPSLTLSEAAEACGVSRSTIRRKHEAGEFPNAYKAGPIGDQIGNVGEILIPVSYTHLTLPTNREV